MNKLRSYSQKDSCLDCYLKHPLLRRRFFQITLLCSPISFFDSGLRNDAHTETFRS